MLIWNELLEYGEEGCPGTEGECHLYIQGPGHLVLYRPEAIFLN